VEEIKKDPVNVIESTPTITPINTQPINNNSAPVRESVITSNPDDGVLK
jgi:hypothetical protein